MKALDWLKGKVIDLRSPEERDREKDMGLRGLSSLCNEDETISHKLVNLINRARNECESNQKDAFAKTKEEIKTIGKYLYANGGDDRTLQVAYRAQALGARLRDFQNYWDGIGHWMY